MIYSTRAQPEVNKSCNNNFVKINVTLLKLGKLRGCIAWGIFL